MFWMFSLTPFLRDYAVGADDSPVALMLNALPQHVIHTSVSQRIRCYREQICRDKLASCPAGTDIYHNLFQEMAINPILVFLAHLYRGLFNPRRACEGQKIKAVLSENAPLQS